MSNSCDLKKGDKQEKAYNYISEKILNNIYKPHHQLNEAELCGEIGDVSRTPVRDALKRLEYEGLIENVQGKGMFVSAFSFEEQLQIIETRLALETFSVELCINRASDDELRNLSEIVDMHSKAFHDKDYQTAIECDNNFHIEIARCSKNSKILEHVQMLIRQNMRGTYYSFKDYERTLNSLNQHKEIRDALLARDVENARKSISTHLSFYLTYMTKKKVQTYDMYVTRLPI